MIRVQAIGCSPLMGEVTLHFLLFGIGQLTAEDQKFSEIAPKVVAGGTAGFSEFDIGQACTA